MRIKGGDCPDFNRVKYKQDSISHICNGCYIKLSNDEKISPLKGKSNECTRNAFQD
jgi:hypothetical protein